MGLRPDRPWDRRALGSLRARGHWLADAGLDVAGLRPPRLRWLRGTPRVAGAVAEFHDDLEDRLAAARAGSAGRPVALYGHSLGGLVALGYCVADRPRPLPDALVVSAPALDSIDAGLDAVARRAPHPGRAARGPEERVRRRGPVARSGGRRALSRRSAEPPPDHDRAWEPRRSRSSGASDGALARLSIPTLVYHGDRRSARADGVQRAPGGPFDRHPTDVAGPPPREPQRTRGPRAVIGDVVAWLRSVLRVGRQLNTASGERERAESVAQPQTRRT